MASARGCDGMRVGLESAEVHSLAKLRNCLSKGGHGPSPGRTGSSTTTGRRLERAH